MTILGQKKRSSVRSGVLVTTLLWSNWAAAEVQLVEKNGWTFSADGRVGAFMSYTFGENFPQANAAAGAVSDDPNMPVKGSHVVLGDTPIASRPSGFGFGSPGHKQANGDNEFNMFRVRSGAFPNMLGFSLAHAVTETTSATGHVQIWAASESLGRDAWYALQPDVRQAYLEVEGDWGKFTAGRTFNILGRMSWEIDNEYAHRYTHGLPCSDDIGPTCGQVGAGALHPGFGAGFIYTTPDMGGLTVDVGLFDPVVMSLSGGTGFPRATIPRPEVAVSYESKLGGGGLLKLSGEAAYQSVSVVQSEDHDGDENTPNQQTETDASIWGVSGGARLELGAARIGAAAFHGKGVGLYYAFQANRVSVGPALAPSAANPAVFAPDPAHSEVRSFTGAHAQLAFVLGDAQVGVGGGVGSVGQLDSDAINTNLSAPDKQIGLSFAAIYNLSDNVVLGLDYMRLMASWHGVPEVDGAGAVQVNPDGSPVLREGEAQAVNFLNAGMTFHW